MNSFSSKTPPQRAGAGTISLIHKTCSLYTKIYLFSSKVSKRDRFGIYLKTENVCLKLIELITTASFQGKNEKLGTLHAARVKIEVLKRFIRITYELKILPQKQYIEFEIDLQEISKMMSGWIKYLG